MDHQAFEGMEIKSVDMMAEAKKRERGESGFLWRPWNLIGRIGGGPGATGKAGFLEEHPDAGPEESRAWLLKNSLQGKVGNFPGPDKAELEAKSLLIDLGS